MRSYEEVLDEVKLIANIEDHAEAVSYLDSFIDLKCMWSIAYDFDALDENRSCEDFSIAHMTEYNKLFGKKY